MRFGTRIVFDRIAGVIFHGAVFILAVAVLVALIPPTAGSGIFAYAVLLLVAVPILRSLQIDIRRAQNEGRLYSILPLGFDEVRQALQAVGCKTIAMDPTNAMVLRLALRDSSAWMRGAPGAKVTTISAADPETLAFFVDLVRQTELGPPTRKVGTSI